MSEFHVLSSSHPLASRATLPLPHPAERKPVTLRDPALAVYSDLRSGPCVVVPPTDGIDATLALMLRAGVRMAFVGEAAQGIGSAEGVVTAGELQGERPLLHALRSGQRHHDLRVADVMTPIADWPLIEFDELRRARVGDVVATLQVHSRPYLLVVETHGGSPRLRGLFSASRIGQALGMPLADDLKSRSFAELEAALHH